MALSDEKLTLLNTSVMMLSMLQTPHVTLKLAFILMLSFFQRDSSQKFIISNLIIFVLLFFSFSCLAFAAQSEGSIPLHEGEELLVIEVDQGDGWTRVRRNSGFEEGFVPTSYIQCALYNTC
jgi:hypothetical protein